MTTRPTDCATEGCTKAASRMICLHGDYRLHLCHSCYGIVSAVMSGPAQPAAPQPATDNPARHEASALLRFVAVHMNAGGRAEMAALFNDVAKRVSK